MKKIQICENNFPHGVEDIANKLIDEGKDVEIVPCLGYCGDCAVAPIALVDDELIVADTAEELYETVKEEA